MSNNLLVITNNGLGDHITSVGAIRFFSTIYDSVHYLCKNKNHDNVKSIFLDMSNLTLIPFNEKIEPQECQRIVNEKRANNFDILTCGVHICHKKRVRNEKLINRQIDNKHYNLDQKYFSSKTGASLSFAPIDFIGHFYSQLNLDLSIYYEWFDIKETENSKKLYDSISRFKIIFTHTKASNSKINLNFVLNKFMQSNEHIIICANENFYSNGKKKEIAKRFVDAPLTDYITTIKNAEEIHIIDSCFSAITLPMSKTNKIKASVFKIYDRKK